MRAGIHGTLTLTVIDDETVRAGWTDATGANLAKQFPTETDDHGRILRALDDDDDLC